MSRHRVHLQAAQRTAVQQRARSRLERRCQHAALRQRTCALFITLMTPWGVTVSAGCRPRKPWSVFRAAIRSGRGNQGCLHRVPRCWRTGRRDACNGRPAIEPGARGRRLFHPDEEPDDSADDQEGEQDRNAPEGASGGGVHASALHGILKVLAQGSAAHTVGLSADGTTDRRPAPTVHAHPRQPPAESQAPDGNAWQTTAKRLSRCFGAFGASALEDCVMLSSDHGRDRCGQRTGLCLTRRSLPGAVRYSARRWLAPRFL
jgi:hypothetical protein